MSTRTAETVAAELYDEPRDLVPFEQEFLLAVRFIGLDCAQVCGAAVRSFGRESKAALAVEFAAKQRRAERYAAALEKYDASVAALDEVEEIEQHEFAA